MNGLNVLEGKSLNNISLPIEIFDLLINILYNEVSFFVNVQVCLVPSLIKGIYTTVGDIIEIIDVGCACNAIWVRLLEIFLCEVIFIRSY